VVPFITWVSALVQYCCIVVESIAAAPLWALAHLQADGEGMGQRTEKGYLYLLNLLFRPILMVAGFFAASALVILLGSVVTQMYIPTIASTQGNSITGLFSIIGFVFLFFVIMNILIQGLFHV
jgi:conjugal transfer/type IV secretion protein DotA/TraY